MLASYSAHDKQSITWNTNKNATSPCWPPRQFLPIRRKERVDLHSGTTNQWKTYPCVCSRLYSIDISSYICVPFFVSKAWRAALTSLSTSQATARSRTEQSWNTHRKCKVRFNPWTPGFVVYADNYLHSTDPRRKLAFATRLVWKKWTDCLQGGL